MHGPKSFSDPAPIEASREELPSEQQARAHLRDLHEVDPTITALGFTQRPTGGKKDEFFFNTYVLRGSARTHINDDPVAIKLNLHDGFFESIETDLLNTHSISATSSLVLELTGNLRTSRECWDGGLATAALSTELSTDAQESLASTGEVGLLAHAAAPVNGTSTGLAQDLLSALEDLLSSVKRGGPTPEDLKNKAQVAINKAHEAPGGPAEAPLQGEALVAKLKACSPVALDLLLALEPLLFAVRHGTGAADWDTRKERATAAIARARTTLASAEPGPAKVDPRLVYSAQKLYDFAALISRMTTDEEMEEGMDADDAIMTVGNLVASARDLVRNVEQNDPAAVPTPRETLTLLKALGLNFSDCVHAFALDQGPNDSAYIAAAREHHEVEGELEFDDSVIVSAGDDPGAYVMGWVWVTNDEAGIKES